MHHYELAHVCRYSIVPKSTLQSLPYQILKVYISDKVISAALLFRKYAA